MKSAYSVLGIPGNASKADIEAAFTDAQAYYSKQKLAADPAAVDKFLDIKNAYKVLRDEESRAAHDRKLSAGVNAPKAGAVSRQLTKQVEPPASSGIGRAVQLMALVIAVVVVSGYYFNAKRETAKKELAALELKTKELAAEEARKEAARAAADEAYRTKLLLINEQKDAQFRQESLRAISIARAAESQRTYQDAQLRANEQREAQRAISDARSQEQNAARVAQQRIAADKARIRELCYQNYRRPDC